MEKDKDFIEKQTENVKGVIKKAKAMFEKDKRSFYKIATISIFGFLFWLGILLPIFGAVNNANVFDMPLGWLWFTVYLVFPFAYAFVAFLGNTKLTKLFLKIIAILSIAIVLFNTLAYILVVVDPTLITPNIKFGFFLALLAAIGLALLQWKENVVLNIVYSVLKVPEDEITEPDVEPEPEIKKEPKLEEKEAEKVVEDEPVEASKVEEEKPEDEPNKKE